MRVISINYIVMELPRNLKVDSVSRLQPAEPRTIATTATVAEALASMRAAKAGCLLVVRDGLLAGIFTERDLLTRVLALRKPLTLTVGECMTPDPVTVNPKDPVRSAIRRMQSGGYRHLPVVDEDGRPVGILSAKRIVHYLAEHFPGTVYNQPPDPKQVPATAEGA
jgi:CBS domain-containing protein